MSSVTKTRKEWAELANFAVQCGSVTYNESADNREDFRKFKLFMGSVSNGISKLAEGWNVQGQELVMLSDDVKDELACYEVEMEKVNECHNKKERKAMRKKVKTEFARALEIEKKAVAKLEKFFNSKESLDFGTFPEDKVPMNINGGFLDVIKCLLS